MQMYTAKLLILLALSVSAVAHTGNDTKNLLTKLFETDGYDKRVRPITNQTHPIILWIGFELISLIDFNEQEETLKTSGYLEAFWVDEYLRWDPADYHNIKKLYIPQDDIWKPDLSLSNSFVTFKGLGSAYFDVNVNSSGFVEWVPYQVMESTCPVNIKYFPFDTQTCNLEFRAWSYFKNAIQLHILNDSPFNLYIPNAAWDLVTLNFTVIDYDPPHFVASLTLKRKPAFFLINIITPMVLLSVLNTFTFMLPVESGEKAGFSMTVFLALAVFLTIISDRLPNNSDTVSLMTIYLTMMTTLSTFVVVACLAQIRLSTRKESEQPVTGLYAAMVKLADCCGCKCRKRKANVVYPTGTDQNMPDEFVVENKPNHLTWFSVIHAMDFLFFWLSISYTILSTTMLASFAVAGK